VHENVFFPVDEDMDLAEATLLLDIMGTGGHAIARAQLVHPDIQSLLIAGAGPVGLGVAAMARLLLGDTLPIAVTDLVPYRLALAEQLGARPIHIGRQSLAEGLRSHGLDQVDVAVDTSGKGVARRACLDCLAQRGLLVCVGHGEGLELAVSRDLIASERAVLGSEYFAFDELPANLARLRVHRAYLSQIITHRVGLAGLQEAFETFFAGNTGKVVVEQ
jgi:threonine dehydrogenase-like Zn-dependent dehydrogenase